MSIVWIAVALGLIEGITEYVPVSSTGHLILAGRWLAFPEEKAASFEIFIQLGAVFAVVWFYRRKLLEILTRLPNDTRAQMFAAKVLLAFVPAAVVGLLFHHWIVRVLFGPLPVAAALAVLLAGLSRRVALEFSFFLAIPTLGAASVFALWEARHVLATSDVPIFALGFAVSFVVSLAVIAALLRYVRDHDLRPFGWYRIALAIVVALAVLRR